MRPVRRLQPCCCGAHDSYQAASKEPAAASASWPGHLLQLCFMLSCWRTLPQNQACVCSIFNFDVVRACAQRYFCVKAGSWLPLNSSCAAPAQKMATPYKAPMGAVTKPAEEESVRVHRIRITLTSKNVVNLEKGTPTRARLAIQPICLWPCHFSRAGKKIFCDLHSLRSTEPRLIGFASPRRSVRRPDSRRQGKAAEGEGAGAYADQGPAHHHPQVSLRRGCAPAPPSLPASAAPLRKPLTAAACTPPRAQLPRRACSHLHHSSRRQHELRVMV